MAHEDNEWIAWLNQVNGEEASTKNDADNPPQRLKVVSSAEKGDAETVEEVSTIEEEAPGESTPVASWDDLFSANAPLSAPASSSASKKSAPWKRRSDSSDTASVAESSDARAPRVEDPHKGGVRRFWPLFAVVVVCALAATTYVGLALSSQFEGNRPESAGADAPSEVAATTTRVASSDLPKDDVTVVSAGCTPSKGEEVMPPSQKNVRSAYISLQQEYAARNADGVSHFFGRFSTKKVLWLDLLEPTVSAVDYAFIGYYEIMATREQRLEARQRARKKQQEIRRKLEQQLRAERRVTENAWLALMEVDKVHRAAGSAFQAMLDAGRSKEDLMDEFGVKKSELNAYLRSANNETADADSDLDTQDDGYGSVSSDVTPAVDSVSSYENG